MHKKYGYWQTSDMFEFSNSYEAMCHASQTKTEVWFKFHNDVWDKFDRTLLGKIPLDSLYKERAQQLRDQYDYLILYYSGGADSHNILRTFIDNNIKLDELCIRWPIAFIKNDILPTNNIDTSASNYWSEWGYAIKPILDEVSKTNPEIKINIVDLVGDDGSNFDIDSIFDSASNKLVGAGVLLYNSFSLSNNELEKLHKGKTVGSIYGVDKPLLFERNDKIGMFFSDKALGQGGSHAFNPTGIEYFYWTPDMPILAFEQAYQMAMYFKTNKWATEFLYRDNMTPEYQQRAGKFQHELARSMLYSNWDNRFQTDKPLKNNRTDKFFWFFEMNEFSRKKEIFLDNIFQRINSLDDRFIINPMDSSMFKTGRVFGTKIFYVAENNHETY